MKKFLCLIVVLAAVQSVHAGQLTYTSPDGLFQFNYPDSLRLITGDATHEGDPAGCGSPPSVTTLACVKYPSEKFKRTTFGNAAFLVNLVGFADSERKCLNYTSWEADEEVKTSTATLNGVEFRTAVMDASSRAYVSRDRLYRIFRDHKCYELDISVGYSQYTEDEKKKLFTADNAEKVYRTLKPMLDSFHFLK